MEVTKVIQILNPQHTHLHKIVIKHVKLEIHLI
jgi:hypothetical protein